MSSMFSTPKKDNYILRDGNNDNNNNIASTCTPCSPSYSPLIGVEGDRNVSSFMSSWFQASSDNNVREGFAYTTYPPDDTSSSSNYDVGDNASFSTDDDSENDSTSSQKSNKDTDTTASTISLSQELAQSFGPMMNESRKEDDVEEENYRTDGEYSLTTDRHSSMAVAALSSSISRRASDMGYFDDFVAEPVLILGFDISHLSPRLQFLVCASGVVGFNLMYGYLQELITVEIFCRKLGLFLAMMQFAGYTSFSYLLQTYVYKRNPKLYNIKQQTSNAKMTRPGAAALSVPIFAYLGLSLLRAVDLAMTNLAMQYINYPAKTLMKSSRVVFTMLFGIVIIRKRYHFIDYFVVLCMVAGLAIFMHADATSSAIFEPVGVMMLTISLLCDGAISNMSESIMKNYGVGQDEFIFRMYSIALVVIVVAAAVKGDLEIGLTWILEPGTYDEWYEGTSEDHVTWSVPGKITVILLFSTMGFFGSSCSAAITKHFGALTMSITSTARKAMTLFLSFFLFNNVCTTQHIAGVVIFIAALALKSLRRTTETKKAPPTDKSSQRRILPDLELQLDMSNQTSCATASPCLKNGTPGRRFNAGKFS